ncbi:response regulator [Variovorax sp. H27-G14]|uniref:hypothetical protein n=1 Tax=Variovorax sp. H27-G14 TaxID=3111914 RepID=UPI0038FCFF40
MSKIVVIEEDGAMRVLISEWLVSEGHLVRSLPLIGGGFTTAADATVDLVVLDLPHPRSRSSGSARAVHVAYPHAAIIGISTQVTRSLDNGSEAARSLGVKRLLAKPFTREELLGAVTAMLAV